MKIGFVMNPLAQVNIHADTTFALMDAAQKRGHALFTIDHLDAMAYEAGAPHAHMVPVTVQRVEGDHFNASAPSYGPMTQLDAVFMRTDPPFDITYLHATHYLSLLEAQGTLVLNRPRGLQGANEKLYTLNFPSLMPTTIVTRDRDRIRRFMVEQGGRCIVKPVDGHGGSGIFLVQEGDRNLNAILEVATGEGREQVMCQRYVPEARQGDKRILMLDGEPLGAILRVPREDDNRGNIHVGGTVQAGSLTARDREICALVGPKLREDGLFFVGLDVLGDYLTEVNVTSPTGIQEMSRLNGEDYADQVIAWIEAKRA